MNPRRILLVGPSGSGKTTVAALISRALGLPVVSMDDFRIRGIRHPPYVMVDGKQIRTYEDPRLWDGHAVACKLMALISAGNGFVAEGNHLLHYAPIAALPDTEHYYLDVPFGVSLDRRKTRHRYLPADESFALIGESETARWIAPQLSHPGIIRLDGLLHPEANAANIVERRFAAT